MRSTALALGILTFVLAAAAARAEISANYYDWMGLADEVAVASAEKADGRLARFRIVSPVRGSSLEKDDRILRELR